MRRALLTLGGTAAGLAALLTFKTHSLAAADPAPDTSASAATSQPVASGTGASPAAGMRASPAPKASPGAASASVGAPASRTVTGTVDDTMYGPMQVQVTLVGTKITAVTVLKRTDDGAMSDQIDATAIPRLTSETLVAQNADIDAVSGASYTSAGYIKSLQSALDQINS